MTGMTGTKLWWWYFTWYITAVEKFFKRSSLFSVPSHLPFGTLGSNLEPSFLLWHIDVYAFPALMSAIISEWYITTKVNLLSLFYIHLGTDFFITNSFRLVHSLLLMVGCVKYLNILFITHFTSTEKI